jgi:hypothetical protein
MKPTTFTKTLLVSALLCLNINLASAESIVVNLDTIDNCIDCNASCDTDSLTPGDQCSLYSAISYANNNSESDIITFDPDYNLGNYNIEVNGGFSNITTPIQIDGSGSLVHIYGDTTDGNQAFRFTDGSVGSSLKNLTINNFDKQIYFDFAYDETASSCSSNFTLDNLRLGTDHTYGEDIDRDGVLDLTEDLNGNGVEDSGEDLDSDGRFESWSEDIDGDGNFDSVNEDTNGNGQLDPGEDLDADGYLDKGEDINYNGILDEGEDIDNDGLLDITEDLDSDGNFDNGEDVDDDGVLDISEDLNGNGTEDAGEDLDNDGLFETNSQFFANQMNGIYSDGTDCITVDNSVIVSTHESQYTPGDVDNNNYSISISASDFFELSNSKIGLNYDGDQTVAQARAIYLSYSNDLVLDNNFIAAESNGGSQSNMVWIQGENCYTDPCEKYSYTIKNNVFGLDVNYNEVASTNFQTNLYIISSHNSDIQVTSDFGSETGDCSIANICNNVFGGTTSSSFISSQSSGLYFYGNKFCSDGDLNASSTTSVADDKGVWFTEVRATKLENNEFDGCPDAAFYVHNVNSYSELESTHDLLLIDNNFNSKVSGFSGSAYAYRILGGGYAPSEYDYPGAVCPSEDGNTYLNLSISGGTIKNINTAVISIDDQLTYDPGMKCYFNNKSLMSEIEVADVTVVDSTSAESLVLSNNAASYNIEDFYYENFIFETTGTKANFESGSNSYLTTPTISSSSVSSLEEVLTLSTTPGSGTVEAGSGCQYQAYFEGATNVEYLPVNGTSDTKLTFDDVSGVCDLSSQEFDLSGVTLTPSSTFGLILSSQTSPVQSSEPVETTLSLNSATAVLAATLPAADTNDIVPYDADITLDISGSVGNAFYIDLDTSFDSDGDGSTNNDIDLDVDISSPTVTFNYSDSSTYLIANLANSTTRYRTIQLTAVDQIRDTALPTGIGFAGLVPFKASFTADATQGLNPFEITLTDSSILDKITTPCVGGCIVSASKLELEIDWGDGTTDQIYETSYDSGFTTSHTYSQAGDYTISYTWSDKTDTSESHQATQLISVLDPVSASFTVDSSIVTDGQTISIDQGDSVTFASTSTNATSFRWDFDTDVDSDLDGTANNDTDSALENPTAKTFNVVGTFTVLLEASNAVSNDTFSVDIQVNAVATPSSGGGGSSSGSIPSIAQQLAQASLQSALDQIQEAQDETGIQPEESSESDNSDIDENTQEDEDIIPAVTQEEYEEPITQGIQPNNFVFIPQKKLTKLEESNLESIKTVTESILEKQVNFQKSILPQSDRSVSSKSNSGGSSYRLPKDLKKSFSQKPLIQVENIQDYEEIKKSILVSNVIEEKIKEKIYQLEIDTEKRINNSKLILQEYEDETPDVQRVNLSRNSDGDFCTDVYELTLGTDPYAFDCLIADQALASNPLQAGQSILLIAKDGEIVPSSNFVLNGTILNYEINPVPEVCIYIETYLEYLIAGCSKVDENGNFVFYNDIELSNPLAYKASTDDDFEGFNKGKIFKILAESKDGSLKSLPIELTIDPSKKHQTPKLVSFGDLKGDQIKMSEDYTQNIEPVKITESKVAAVLDVGTYSKGVVNFQSLLFSTSSLTSSTSGIIQVVPPAEYEFKNGTSHRFTAYAESLIDPSLKSEAVRIDFQVIGFNLLQVLTQAASNSYQYLLLVLFVIGFTITFHKSVKVHRAKASNATVTQLEAKTVSDHEIEQSGLSSLGQKVEGKLELDDRSTKEAQDLNKRNKTKLL